MRTRMSGVWPGRAGDRSPYADCGLRYTTGAMNRSRRLFTFVLALGPLAFISYAETTAPPAQHAHYSVLVGTYTTKTQSKGIYAFDFDPDTGKLTDKGVAAETPDPSWVVIHPNGKFVYAANEAAKKSTISAFARNPQTGALTLLNELPSLGEDPCHLSFDKTGNFLFVANYTSGTVAVFPILHDGKLGEGISMLKDAGPRGPDKQRQEGPHAHWVQVSMHNRYAYVADLGLDRVLIYKFDEATGTLTAADSTPPDPEGKSARTNDPYAAVLSLGTGPRHAAFSADGNFLYVLGELKSTVTAFANAQRESFHSVQEISALPEGFSGRNDAAEISLHPSGKWLYTSNRGADTIAVFAVDPYKGTLRVLANVPTGGKEPRHFAIDPTGHYLLAENQNSDTIVVFRIDQSNGLLTATGEIAHVPSPVCLTFYPAQ
jgi:6-phosphogluconolactonase